MSDEIITSITTSSWPTNEFRWLVLTGGNALRLQQQWSVTTYGPDDVVRQDYEWRDVPMVEG